VAIDECRIGFPCSLWGDLDESNQRVGRRAYEQRWFVGTHGDIGGGESSNLSAASLKWIAEGAANAGLRFYADYGDDVSPLHEKLRDAGYDAPISRPRLSKAWQPVHYPFRPRRIWSNKDKPTRPEAELLLDENVFRRSAIPRPRYRPGPLKPFSTAFKEWQKDHRE
jgi:hypothetical protein